MTPSTDQAEIAEHRQKKLERIPQFKKAMAKALVDTAASPEWLRCRPMNRS